MLVPAVRAILESNGPLLVLVVGLGTAIVVVLTAVGYRRERAQATASKPRLRVPRPTPSALPLVGNLIDILVHGDKLYELVLRHCLAFKNEPWKISVPGQPEVVIISTPEGVDEIFAKQFANFPKGRWLFDLVRDLFGTGLATSDGERWIHQRKTAVKFFSAKVLRTLMTETMHRNMRKVFALLDDSAARGEVLDLAKLFVEFTLETFADLGLGKEMNCIRAENPHPFEHALDAAAPIICRRFRCPGWYWKLERWLNVGPERRLAEHVRVFRAWLHETTQASVQRALEHQTRGERVPVRSVVELFLEHSRESAEGLQAHDLEDFLLNVIIAARDTTAGTLAWFFYLLRDHPEVERKIREEMSARLGDAGARDEYLTTDHTQSLVYMEAAIKEAIRLYPAAPVTLREVAQDTIICGDIPLRKGQVIMFAAHAMARSPGVWGPDAAEYKPERWIDSTTGQLRQFPSNKFFSFSSGPRTCIGMNLAMIELRIVVANLLSRYHFDVDARNKGDYLVAPTMVMRDPLLARPVRV